jgi:hypothetical protein
LERSSGFVRERRDGIPLGIKTAYPRSPKLFMAESHELVEAGVLMDAVWNGHDLRKSLTLTCNLGNDGDDETILKKERTAKALGES